MPKSRNEGTNRHLTKAASVSRIKKTNRMSLTKDENSNKSSKDENRIRVAAVIDKKEHKPFINKLL